jgi:hypothetical protein
MAIDFGAPALATAFGIPGPVSSFAIQKLKQALGLAADATPAETQAAAQADPETAKAAFQAAQTDVTAKYAYLTALAQTQADIAKANISAVNETIRTEAAQGVSWWHWRHLIGYVLVMLGAEVIALLPLVAFGKIEASVMAAIIGSLTPITTVFAGLNGYIAQDTSAVKVAAITGQPVPGILSSVVKAVTPKAKPK